MKIRQRVMFWVAGAGLLSSLVFSLVVFFDMRDEPLEVIDSQLKAAAETLVEQLGTAQQFLTGEQEKVLFISSEHYWIRVYDQDLHPVYQSELSKVVDLPLYQDKGEKAYMVGTRISKKRIDLHQDNTDSITFRVRVFAEKSGVSPFLVQIAMPVEDLQEETFQLLAAIGIGLAVSTCMLIGLSYMLAGRIVKPIAVINSLARDIDENTLEKRIPLGKSRDEIYELSTHLNQMFDRLQYSFDRQKRFLADSSHELKSPLAMLRFFFDEACQRSDLPEDFLQQFYNQGSNILRMDRLVRTLLDLSVLEIDASLTLEPLDIIELTSSTLGDFVPLFERAKIRLETEMPQQLEILGDKDKLRRVLINIVDNAIKYTVQEGQIRLVISLEKNLVHLFLLNTGPGIPGEDLPKVFDQFYRVDKSRSSQLGGAGLGLAIVREIIRLHKGSVSIDSQQGLWTRVDIFLPQDSGKNSITKEFHP